MDLSEHVKLTITMVDKYSIVLYIIILFTLQMLPCWCVWQIWYVRYKSLIPCELCTIIDSCVTAGGLVNPDALILAVWLHTQQRSFNTLRLGQNGRHFPDDIFKCIFFNENIWILITFSLKLVPKHLVNNVPALVQIMTWCQPLSEPMVVRLPISVVRVSFNQQAYLKLWQE